MATTQENHVTNSQPADQKRDWTFERIRILDDGLMPVEGNYMTEAHHSHGQNQT